MSVTRALALLILLGLAALTALRYAPPAPRPSSAPTAEFSAERAGATLARILGDGAPHPTGSRANVEVRKRILAELRGLGYAPEVLRGIGCGLYGLCTEVHDVVTVIPGRVGGKAILLSAHYDSVPAGPGAGDDGSGVAAVLEIARALRQAAALNQPLVLLLTDGEEAGLIGARVFMREHRLAREIGVAINLEARGTTGPSVMFETTEPNAWLIRTFAGAVSRPVTNSAAYSVYKKLPNDTDLTVFRSFGLAGLGFAFIGGAARYHTPLDSLAQLDLGSLQQHGAAALACVRALAASDLRSEPGNAVFFDVWALVTVWWPEWLNFVLVSLATLVLAASIRLLARRGDVRVPVLGVALIGLPLALATAGALGFALTLVLAGTAVPAPWIAAPLALELTCLAVAATAIATSALALARFADPLSTSLAFLIWWTLLAWVLVVSVPGAAYLFVLPALIGALARLGAVWSSTRVLLASALLAPLAITALLWFPILYLINDAIGVSAALVQCLILALVLGPCAALVPAFERRPLLLVGVGASLCFVLGAVARLTSPFSATSPQRLSLAYHLDADAHTARWLIDANGGQVPARVREAAGASERVIDPYPWFGGWGRATLSGPARAIELEAPEAEVLGTRIEHSAAGDLRHVDLELRSARSALALSLGISATAPLYSAKLEGQAVEPAPTPGERVITFAGAADRGVRLELVFASAEPVDALLFDHSPGLPEQGRAIAEARGTAAVPSQSGDMTVVSRHIRL